MIRATPTKKKRVFYAKAVLFLTSKSLSRKTPRIQCDTRGIQRYTYLDAALPILAKLESILLLRVRVCIAAVYALYFVALTRI